MPVMRATAADLALVKNLVHDAARRQVGLGEEDLASLVAAGHVLLAIDDAAAAVNVTAAVDVTAAVAGSPSPVARNAVHALAAFYPEPRPVSLPPTAPDRVFLRAAAFRGGSSPSAALAELVAAWAGATWAPRLLIAYGGEPWFNRSLLAAGCTLAEEVIYYALPDLQRTVASPPAGLPAGAQPAILRLAVPAELASLALLDTACFNVLWHMGVADLRQLLLFGRLTVAVRDGALVGYLALTVKDTVAQVARLAVHPAWSGHGIGRQLLADGLLAAAEGGCDLAVLNTQSHNTRSQAIYRSFGFRPTGEHFEVYTRLAPLTRS